ncbi:hypothetical protein F4802DRAFT_618636 [Xylaria palmicola]|nr:hypothetical protein F4802DRAFT_618636 [Xylaria palmicola]
MSARKSAALTIVALIFAKADAYFEVKPLGLGPPQTFHGGNDSAGRPGDVTPDYRFALTGCTASEPGTFAVPETMLSAAKMGTRAAIRADARGQATPAAREESGVVRQVLAVVHHHRPAALPLEEPVAGYKCCGARQQCPSSSKCCVDEDGDNYCADECVPSLIFPYVQGFLDEVYENMCKGTAASSTTNDPRTAILTLDPKSGKALRRSKASRRRSARCTGSGKLQCPKGYSCDEFPFASSLEGGSGAQILCIPKWQNDWQGTYYGSWLSEQTNSGKLVRGGKYRVKIKGLDCSQYTKRDLTLRDTPSQILSSNGSVTILSESAFGDYSTNNNALFIDLTESDSTPGTYTLDYSLSNGTVLSGGIIDDSGEYLVNLSSISSSTDRLTVNIEEDDGDITFLGWTKDTNVQVEYSVSSPSPSSTASPTTGPTATESAGLPEESSSLGDRTRASLLVALVPLMYFAL